MGNTPTYGLWYPDPRTNFKPSSNDMKQMIMSVESQMFALEQRVQGGEGGALWNLQQAMQAAVDAKASAQRAEDAVNDSVPVAQNALSVANGIDAKAQEALDKANLSIAPVDNQVAGLFNDEDSATSTAMKSYMQGYATSDELTEMHDDILGIRSAFNRTTPHYVGTFRTNGGALFQSFAIDPVTGYVFAVRGDVGTTEDMIIHRYTPDLTFVDKCTLVACGHGNSIEVEHDANGDVWIWVWWENDTSSAYKGIRFKYQGSASGLTFARTSSRVQTLPDVTPGRPTNAPLYYTIDALNNRVAIRYSEGSGGHEKVFIHDKTAFLAGTNNALGTLSIPWKPDNLDWQGFQLVDGDVVDWRGGAYGVGVPTLYRYPWDGSPGTGKWDLGYLATTGGDALSGENEAEGISMSRAPDGTPTLVFCIVSGGAGQRRNALYSITATGGDTMQRPVLQQLDLRAQCGTVSVTPSGKNVPTSVYVKFEKEFPRTPVIVVTANSSVPGTQVVECSFRNPNSKGFYAVLTRTNKSATQLNWIAMLP